VENAVLARDLAERGRLRYERLFRPAAIRGRLRELLAEVEESG